MSTEYDAVNRPVKVIDALNKSTLYEYDANDNVRLLIDALSGQTSTTYDEEDQPLTVTDYANPTNEKRHEMVKDYVRFNQIVQESNGTPVTRRATNVTVMTRPTAAITKGAVEKLPSESGTDGGALSVAASSSVIAAGSASARPRSSKRATDVTSVATRHRAPSVSTRKLCAAPASTTTAAPPASACTTSSPTKNVSAPSTTE